MILKHRKQLVNVSLNRGWRVVYVTEQHDLCAFEYAGSNGCCNKSLWTLRWTPFGREKNKWKPLGLASDLGALICYLPFAMDCHRWFTGKCPLVGQISAQFPNLSSQICFSFQFENSEFDIQSHTYRCFQVRVNASRSRLSHWLLRKLDSTIPIFWDIPVTKRILEKLVLGLDNHGQDSFWVSVQTTFHEGLRSPIMESWIHELRNGAKMSGQPTTFFPHCIVHSIYPVLDARASCETSSIDSAIICYEMFRNWNF